MNVDALKPAPLMDTVRFESVPPGAEAKTSNGQSCRTPCALALPTNAPLTVTFSLNGYQTQTESLEVVELTGSAPSLRPNPVMAELTAAPAPAKPAKKKPAAKKPAAKKPAAARPKPATASAPTAAPMTAAPAQQQSPWPATPAQR